MQVYIFFLQKTAYFLVFVIFLIDFYRSYFRKQGKEGKMSGSTLNLPSRSGLWYLFSGVFSKALGILLTPVFTRLLSPEEYGSAAFYLSSLAVLEGIIAPFAFGSGVYGLISRERENKRELLLSGILSVFAICAAVCILLFAFSSLLSFGKDVIIFLSLQIFFDSVISLYLTFKRFDYSYKTVCAVGIFESVLSFLLSLCFIKGLSLGYLGRVFGLLAVSGAIAGVIIIKGVLGAFRGLAGRLFHDFFAVGLPLFPGAAIGSLGGQLDRLLCAYLLGAGAMGKYSVSHSLGVGLYFVITSLSSVLTPWTVRRLALGEEHRIKEVTGSLIQGISAVSLFLVALSPEALRLLAPPDYYEALPAVAPIALSVIPLFFTSVSSTLLVQRGRGAFITVSKLSSLAAGGVSGLFLIPVFGFLGAGIGVLLSELVGAYMLLLYIKRREARLLYSPYDMTKALIVPLIFGLMFSVLSAYPALRILLLTVPAVMLLNIVFKAKGIILER